MKHRKQKKSICKGFSDEDPPISKSIYLSGTKDVIKEVVEEEEDQGNGSEWEVGVYIKKE